MSYRHIEDLGCKAITDSRHAMPVSANALVRRFNNALSSLAWVCNITYLRTGSGWLCWAAVLNSQLDSLSSMPLSTNRQLKPPFEGHNPCLKRLC